MTREEREYIKQQYIRLQKVEELETKVSQMKEVKRTLTGSLGNFKVDWDCTLRELYKYTNAQDSLKTVFNYELTGQEFIDRLKTTIQDYLTSKIAELEQQIESL